MTKHRYKTLIGILCCCCSLSSIGQTQLAFPTAEGYGKFTVGGRGGKIYEVTNLNDSGEGSLRAAVEAKEPRTVVFRVSGTIDLKSNLDISNPYITIAGQTAPGDGICLKRYPLMIRASEVIIRHIRVRLGDEAGVAADAISSRYNTNVILDHVSASWSVDETLSLYHCENVTVQWCLVAESMYHSKHGKGTHGFGGIWGGNRSSYHHNLLAHHTSRNPRFASGVGHTDYRNNVIYNWGYNSAYGGENQQKGSEKFIFSTLNMVANYYQPGPATVKRQMSYRVVSPSSRAGDADYGKWHVADNFMQGNAEVTADNWNGGVQANNGQPQPESFVSKFKLDQPWDAMPITQQSAQAAYQSVLDNVGATLPRRDVVDSRIIAETRSGNATYEGPAYKEKYAKNLKDSSAKTGIIDSQTDVGGWPELKSAPAPADTDHDGMPDEWEMQHKLDPKNPEDRNQVAPDGYTMLEKYLNGIK